MKHIPRKRFGQNFLRDFAFQQQIIQALNIQQADHWIEVGPGQGALTEPLAQQCQTLELVELDRDLARDLAHRYAQQTHITVHSCDALTFDFCRAQRIRLVGNLPYNISTPLIFRFLAQRACIQDAHFLLQKEVVDRMAATPGHKTYGRLSVTTQQAFQITPLFIIPPQAFHPQPKVQSCFVRLVPHATPPVTVRDQDRFNAVVKQAFAQKRKTLKNNLKDLIGVQDLLDMGIRPEVRAETLDLAQFAQLADFMTD